MRNWRSYAGHGLALLSFFIGLTFLLGRLPSPEFPAENRPAARVRSVEVAGAWHPPRPKDVPAQRTRREERPPGAPLPVPTPAPEPPPAPTPRTHTVGRGERLWTIAQKYWGRGELWRELAYANPNVDPNRLKPGMSLVIPDVAGKRQSDPPEQGRARVHLVKEGETLGEIAVRYYGRADWAPILAANPKIDDPHRLRVGTELRIPPPTPNSQRG